MLAHSGASFHPEYISIRAEESFKWVCEEFLVFSRALYFLLLQEQDILGLDKGRGQRNKEVCRLNLFILNCFINV